VSLTTIGYGDITPITTLGRLFGSACVVTGGNLYYFNINRKNIVYDPNAQMLNFLFSFLNGSK
jgi:hypothetical protein